MNPPFKIPQDKKLALLSICAGITLDIKERPLLQKMLLTVKRHDKKKIRNYNLTASLEVHESSWDRFGLFMLIRRASSRHSFRC